MTGDIVSIQFDRCRNPLYQSLADALEKWIRDVAIGSGERLPAVRKLAGALRVNVSTVVAAYRYLEEKGLVYTKPGSGTYCLPAEKAAGRDDASPDLLAEYADISNGQMAVSEGVINLAGNSPSPDAFPVSDFQKAMNDVLETDGGYAFSYQESEGYYPLREILGGFSRRQYGIRCTPEQILITSGAQQALDLITKATLRPGDTVLAEMPSYIGMRSVFSMHDARILGVPVESDGLNLDIAAYYARQYRPRLLYTMPVYQTPTGRVLSAAKREKLLELAETCGFYIIEDDLFSDISLAGDRVPPLKAQDAHDRVIYVKSFSKLLMPGIRTGYMVVPGALFEKMAEAKYATDISGSGFIQRALAAFFKNGGWSRNADQLTGLYRERLHAAVRILSEWKRYGVCFDEVRGGFGLWLTLPEGIGDREIYGRCRENRVLVAPGSLFYLSPTADFERHLRINFAASDPLEKGLQIVGECIRSAVNRRSRHTIFI